MGGARVTSIQVAKRAGVSQSAVSRVFTPGASVSKKTADKVKKAAEELGYRPNVLARSLITGRSRMIGLLVAYLENYFYPEALEKLSNALQKRGYHVLVFMAQQTTGDIDQVLDEILDYQVDGIVMASVAISSELAARCQAAGVPVVLFNRNQDDERLSAVTSDNVAGGRKIADFLVRAGHRRIGYIAGWEGASTQRDREDGFRRGLAEKGVELHAREAGNFRYEEAQEAARRMFGSARSAGRGIRRQRSHGVRRHGRAALRTRFRRARRRLGRRLRRRAARCLARLRSDHGPPARQCDGQGNGGDPSRQYRNAARRSRAASPSTGPLIARGSARKPEDWSAKE